MFPRPNGLARSSADNDPLTSARARAVGPLHWLALGLFALTVLLSIAAVKITIGPVPVRLLILIASSFCLLLADAETLTDSIRRSRWLILVVALTGLLGIVVSLLAGAPPADLMRQLLEIHVQSIFNAVVAYALILRFGIARPFYCFLAAFALSAVVAVGQALQIDAAWAARAAIGGLMRDDPLTQHWYLSRERALGLSFSPVHFGTQSCLAFAAVVLMRFGSADFSFDRIDRKLVAAMLVLIALNALTGNRSPLLGMVVFLAVYGLVVAPRIVLIALPVALTAALVLPILMESLSQVGVRVAETEDGSAAGRATLRAFGLFLLQQRPIGYGLTFESTDYWSSFAHRASYMDSWLAIRQYALHNYFLNVLNKYGILLLMVLPMIAPRNKRQLAMWFAFLPYIIHIYYHNDGPLLADFMIFFLLPAALLLAGRGKDDPRGGTAQPVPAHKWRRAFARPAG
jgi:hypothetical protein